MNKTKRIYKLRLHYPEVTIWRISDGPVRFKSHKYLPTLTSWERLLDTVNRRIEASGFEFDDLSEATILL